uniref:THAP-type domain-containing protein n=1 Tax=Neogobius melanostomus TaxID=47308 RepID=A0A8C6UDS4_9GOBI
MAQSKSNCFCSVPGCSSWAKKQPYLSFHTFPKHPEQRKQWIRAVRRDEGPNFCVKKGSTFVCSRHFTQEHYVCGATVSRLKSGAVPTLFPWNNFTEPTKWESAIERAQNQQLFLSQKSNQAEPAPAPTSASAPALAPASAPMDHDYVAPPPTGSLDKALEYIKELEARLEKVTSSPMLFSRYCASDDQIRFYTNFPSERVFRIFWESIAPSASRLEYWTRAQNIGDKACATPSPARSMPMIDEFLMYSFRVAVGMEELLIADMFQVSVATVSRVTITWANYLFIMFSSINMWISQEKVKASMPQRFLKSAPNVRVIFDCTEVALATVSSHTLQSETFSAYKKCSTLKGLIGVAPCGLVTFVSPLYTGCISDKEITRISGILRLVEPGTKSWQIRASSFRTFWIKWEPNLFRVSPVRRKPRRPKPLSVCMSLWSGQSPESSVSTSGILLCRSL